MKAIYVPVEPIENRCFSYWMDDWYDSLKKEYDDVVCVAPLDIVPEDAGDSGILDIAGTTKWKLWQLQRITEMFERDVIEDGDVFVFGDLWFPGIEIVPYLSNLFNIKTRITGCLHGGTWVNGDYTRALDWSQWYEATILNISDVIIFATHTHLSDLINQIIDTPLEEHLTKCIVTGYPVEFKRMKKAMYNVKKKKQIIYSQRVDEQKRTNDVLKTIEMLWDERQDFTFVMTSGTTKKLTAKNPGIVVRMENMKEKMGESFVVKEDMDRQEYIDLLCESAVFISFAQGETFGYSLVEAVACGCTPVVSHGVTHNEILNGDTRFIINTKEEALEKINKYLDNNIDISYYVARYEKDIIFDNMTHATKWLGWSQWR